MPRTDLFLKIELEHDEDEPPERRGQEICRQIAKLYGVRKAELSSCVTKAE